MVHVAVCCGEDCDLPGRLRSLCADSVRFPRGISVEGFSGGKAFQRALEAGTYFQVVFLDMGADNAEAVALGRRLRERFNFFESLLIYLADIPGTDTVLTELFHTCPFQLLGRPVGEKELEEALCAALNSLFQSPGIFAYRKNRSTYQVRKRDIVCLESVGRNIELTTGSGERVRFAGALKNLLGQFEEQNFVHPHLSFIVNLDYVEAYHTRELSLPGGRAVPISEKRAEEVKAAALAYWRRQRALYHPSAAKPEGS